MVSKRYWLSLVSWTLLITISSLLISLLWAQSRSVGILIGGGVIMVVEVVAFVTWLNRVNRQITFLFNALENHDTSIRFPAEHNSKTLRELYSSLNHVLSVFQELKLEHAAREQLFISMIEHSSTGFISVDEHGDFEIMNKAARKMLGINYTLNLDRLRVDYPELYKVIQRLKPGEIESCRIEKSDGPTIIQVSSAGLRFHNREFILISLQDIKNEIDAKEMESWQKLIRIINHEIMNSIAPIVSVSKSLKPFFSRKNGPAKPGEIDEKRINDTISGLEIIETMSSGLQNFVHNYRKLSQIPEPVIALIDAVKWAERLESLGQELIPSGLATLTIELKSGVQKFDADEGLLNQVMTNLIKNALEAPIQKGKKHIKATVETATSGKTAIRVINNGVPISTDIQDKIFVPFYSTKENGAGIGLFLSRQIINGHRGSISAFTNQNSETVFEILLPGHE